MTVKEFNIWLVSNELTQAQLAKKLGLTPHTITNYKKNSFFPVLFVYALAGLEISICREAAQMIQDYKNEVKL